MVELIEARVEKGFQTSMTEEQMRSHYCPVKVD